ncbi:serine hydrolase [Aliidiomarina sp.]|uniref:serine hydrolase n=1 Tax=Aliidiomarina sp. TaxID=1872439 RepID=UPI003A4D30D4
MQYLTTQARKTTMRRTIGSLGMLLALSTQIAFASATASNNAVIEADERLAGLHQHIEATRAQWDIPGVGVAVVYKDEIIHMSGYGVLQQGENANVNPDTLFGVASTSKAMTAASLAMLVDEGKLDWDDRVIDHLPWFALSDPWVTAEVRVRDLLTHRVGVGRMTGNRLQFMPTASRQQVIEQMRYHEFEAPFRSRYVYSNVMYSTAGEIIAAITGQSWDAFMAQRLFQPLNMQRSNTSITQFADGDSNIAWPHQFIDGELVKIARRNFDNVGPSASVNTSVHDMAQWMRLQLGEPGVYNGTRILSEQVMAEMHRPQIATGRNDRTEAVRAYGFGWALDEYQGFQRSQHGGATDGFNTSLVLVPELDLGIVVITNTFSTYMHALVNDIVDRMAELPSQDWNGEYFERYNAQYERVLAERLEIEAERELNTTPSMPAEQLLGSYHDQQYGEVQVFKNENGGLSLHFWDDGVSILDLEHWHHDTYRAAWRNRAQREKFVHFTRARDGKPASLEVTFTLRPAMLQVGIYPTPYYRNVSFKRK